MTRGVKIAVVVGFLLALGAGVALAVKYFQSPYQGPRPVVWDKQVCSGCGMSISDRGFAAQLHAHDGQVFDFDDPGCLFIHVLDKQTDVRAMYFHAMTAEDWLSADDVGFVPTDRSPMDFGWGAVPRNTPGAIGWRDAVERFRRQREQLNRQEGEP